jgi:hypothetical protein
VTYGTFLAHREDSHWPRRIRSRSFRSPSAWGRIGGSGRARSISNVNDSCTFAALPVRRTKRPRSQALNQTAIVSSFEQNSGVPREISNCNLGDCGLSGCERLGYLFFSGTQRPSNGTDYEQSSPIDLSDCDCRHALPRESKFVYRCKHCDAFASRSNGGNSTAAIKSFLSNSRVVEFSAQPCKPSSKARRLCVFCRTTEFGSLFPVKILAILIESSKVLATATGWVKLGKKSTLPVTAVH